MKNVILLAIFSVPNIALAVPDNALDYCATVESWPAQQVIQAEYQKDNHLNRLKATATLIVRTPLKKGSVNVIFKEWEQLYTQTIEVVIPYHDVKKQPAVFLASSIISAEECSLTSSAYFEMTP